MSLISGLSKATCGFLRTGTETIFGLQQVRNKWTNWHMLKDYKRRMCVKEHAADRLRLVAIKRNDILPFELREAAADELHNNFPRDSSRVRCRERCMITSRPRGCVKRFRVSRIMFRHFADYNLMAGMQRAMW
ncbi:CLUMA_CG005286, isoform A [Clunio marinus]|uniref:Small ribosomal subunit protein uS14 n=1 Tax=Clunio marinus TaxID=568069 RepID=A0A1J1HVQ5_9DIPT|nr:CLUMA_CG005286, isoform A [Clunio marinus]